MRSTPPLTRKPTGDRGGKSQQGKKLPRPRGGSKAWEYVAGADLGASGADATPDWNRWGVEEV